LGITRRSILRSWIVSLLGKRSAASTSIGLDPVSLTLRGFAPTVVFQRRYRMDAAILLFGAPLFKRKAAGGAGEFARWIVEWSHDPERLAQMRLRAREHAERFSWDAVWENVYRRYEVCFPRADEAGPGGTPQAVSLAVAI